MFNRFFGALVAFLVSFSSFVQAQGIRFENPTRFDAFGLHLDLGAFNRNTESCGTPQGDGKPKYIFWEHGKKDVPGNITLWCAISRQHIPSEKFGMLVVELQSGASLQDARNFVLTYTSGVYNPTAGTHFVISMADSACSSSKIFVAMEQKEVEMHICPFTANGGERFMVDLPITTRNGKRVVAIVYSYDRYFPITRTKFMEEVRRIMSGDKVS